MIQLDESVMSAVEELRALLAEESAAQADAKASTKRPESSLSVREVQARLRRGRTIEQVAREAGVDSTWVARFAVPVLAEQAEIIRAARATKMTKHRVGLSSAPLGDAVYRNLAERGLADPREQLDKAWRARQLTEGMWLVTMKYTLRGRESEAVWEYDEAAGALRARGRLGTQLGYREPTRRAASTSRAANASTPAPRTKKAATRARATNASTARRSPSKQTSKRVASARRAAAARMVSEAEKATRRNAALARKAAKKPVVLVPREDVAAPARQPLLVDEALEAPARWDDELELAWEDADVAASEDGDVDEYDDDAASDGAEQYEDEVDEDIASYWDESDDGADEDESDVDGANEYGYEDEPDPGLEEAEAEDEVEVPDLDGEVEGDVEVEAPRAPVRVGRRREPLRARPVEASSSADRARRRVRLRSAASAEVEPPDTGNGPVFRSDLAQPASDGQSFPRSALGPTPAPPLTPLQPIEPPPRRRRRRPLRGR